jgi:hypothetical protein
LFLIEVSSLYFFIAIKTKRTVGETDETLSEKICS